MGTEVIAPRYSKPQIDLIRETVAKDCNEAEFRQFMEMAVNYNANPLTRQIYAIVVNKHDDDKRQLVPVMAIDLLRARTKRAGDQGGFLVRANETEPDYELDERAKSDWNPIGLIKAAVAYHVSHDQAKTWHPVVGVAYWDEFAPLVANGNWVETGEVWEDSGRPKKTLMPDGTYRIAKGKEMWLKMPRNQLAKCAEAQTCRKIAPDDVGGLYAPEEMDRPMTDITAEVERLDEQERWDKVGGKDAINVMMELGGNLEAVPVGEFTDRLIERIEKFKSRDDLFAWWETNRSPRGQHWAKHPSDGLAIKQAYEQRLAELADRAAQDVDEARAGHKTMVARVRASIG